MRGVDQGGAPAEERKSERPLHNFQSRTASSADAHPMASQALSPPAHLTASFREFYARECSLRCVVGLCVIVAVGSGLKLCAFALAPHVDRARWISLSWMCMGIPVTLIAVLCLLMKVKARTERAWVMPSFVAQNVLCVLTVAYVGLRLIARVQYGGCVTGSELEAVFCNPNAPHGLPEETLIETIMLPIIFPSVFCDMHWRVVLTTWLMSCVAVVTCLSQLEFINLRHAAPLALCLALSLVALYSNQVQNVRSFVLQHQLATVIRHNEEMGEELRADELRSMIGNVAHDLKTPLASFVSGLDLIADIAQDGMLLVGSAHSAVKMRAVLDGVLATVQNSRNVNTFMMMTINRCIDYTKASRGLKLVPKLESVDLHEALSVPLRCVRDLSSKVQVVMEPLEATVCRHVATDKQWLQENVLCLLSNAVKYSDVGPVTVRVRRAWVQEVAPWFDHITKPSVQTPPSPDARQDPRMASATIHIDADHEAADTEVLLVEIEDSGTGVPNELAQSLFGAFRQTERLAGGTGLGLFALARRIEALDGMYGVKRRPDGSKGSLFWFTIPYLPLAEWRNSNAMTKGGASEVSSVQSGVATIEAVNWDSDHESVASWRLRGAHLRRAETDPLRVLIVDDSLSIQKMMSLMLRRHGHDVSVADNGAIALSMITSTHGLQHNGDAVSAFDVVLMDQQMPVMDGLEATRRVREAESRLMESFRTEPLHNESFDFDSLQLARVGDDERSARDWLCANTASTEVPQFCTIRVDNEEGVVSPSSRLCELHCAAGDGCLVRGVHQLIIGVSANSDMVTTQSALAAGVDAFIAKPFTIDSFYQSFNAQTRGLKFRAAPPSR